MNSLKMVYFYGNISEYCLYYLYVFHTVHLVGSIKNTIMDNFQNLIPKFGDTQSTIPTSSHLFMLKIRVYQTHRICTRDMRARIRVDTAALSQNMLQTEICSLVWHMKFAYCRKRMSPWENRFQEIRKLRHTAKNFPKFEPLVLWNEIYT